MLINREVIEELYEDAGIGRRIRAEDYVKQKRVRLTKTYYEDSNNFDLHAIVQGKVEEEYKTYISVKKGEIQDASCECIDYQSTYGTCKHILAMVLEFINQKELESKIQEKQKGQKEKMVTMELHKEEYRNFKQLLNTFYPAQERTREIRKEKKQAKHTVQIKPKFILEKFQKKLKLEFKIGEKQFYKIKNLSQFYDAVMGHKEYHYGAKLDFVHEMDMFTKESVPLVEFILKYAELMNYVNAHISASYYGPKPISAGTLVLTKDGLDEIFSILKGKQVAFQDEYGEEEVFFVDQNPQIEFKVEKINKNEYHIIPNIEIFQYHILEGKDNLYFLYEGTFYRCTKEFSEGVLKMLEVFRRNFTEEMIFQKEDLTSFFSFILPKVKTNINIEKLDQAEVQKYMPKELAVKLFLDFDENNFMTAEVRFCYGEKEFNPICQTIDEPRDMVKEDEVTNIFQRTGFLLDQKNARFILTKEENIYHFLSEEIAFYMQEFEVMVTDRFKQREIRMPKLESIGVRVENNLLDIQLGDMNFDKEELQEILQKYRLRKKYHRLKDGSFLNLEENDAIAFLDNMTSGLGIEDKQLQKGELYLPMYRSLYLDTILNSMKQVEIQKSDSYKQMTEKVKNRELEAGCVVPEELENVLRYYQKIGFQWLKTLDYYILGGILADDMGLRKNHTNACCYCILFRRTYKGRKKALFSGMSKFTIFKLEKGSRKICKRHEMPCN